MAIEHDAIPDAERHQPIGASTAVAGEMYVSDGVGGGAWERSGMSDHAEMTITNNAIVTAVTAAGDSTLNTDADYIKVTAGWAVTHADGITFSTDKLVIAVSGDYELKFWCSLKVPSINNFIGIKYAINDTPPYSAQKIVSQSSTSNDYRNLFASGMISLTAGQTISVYVAGTKNDNLIFEEAGMQLKLIHE